MVIEELKKHIIYEGNDMRVRIVNALANKVDNKRWHAGDQLSALTYYLKGGDGKIVVEASDGDYEGEHYAVIFCENKYWIWRSVFATYSGCDSIENKNLQEGYEYIMDTMTGVKEFETVDLAIKYLEEEQSKEILYGEKRCIQELLLTLLYIQKDNAKKLEEMRWKQVQKLFLN